jgi:hypothetical protein
VHASSATVNAGMPPMNPYFSSSGAVEDRAFAGSQYLLGEFGWLGVAGMLILGVGFVWWHFRTPTKDGLSPKEPTGYESPLMWLWFRNTRKLKTPAAERADAT